MMYKIRPVPTVRLGIEINVRYLYGASGGGRAVRAHTERPRKGEGVRAPGEYRRPLRVQPDVPAKEIGQGLLEIRVGVPTVEVVSFLLRPVEQQ